MSQIQPKNLTTPSEGYTRLSKICSDKPISPATIWRKVRGGTFPKPVKLSAGITAWKDSELAEWEKDPMNYRAKP